ncbi:hypothetical protein K6119_02855 [Paracrocinitomix mangrovi]|uniref:LIC11966 family surface protein n=1 Tax=Paracrocinitomix mangrovi TaxID=2862509 RepID=UPI001C8F1D6E|nr:hypothetical protein [Paracrocinitomix mangrovi]UKN02460.1 hypothetical protein K6119_02855 [Paracrocinitomix mangrovi]
MLKKYIPILTLLIVSCGGNETAETTEENIDTNSNSEIIIDQERVSAVEFNNELTFMQHDMLSLVSELFQSDSANIEANYSNILFEIDIKLDKLSKMSFDGTETPFVNAMTDLVEFYKEEMNGEFQEIMPLLKKADLSSAELDQLDAYDLAFAKREKAMFEKVIEEQDKFAKQHNIRLEEQAQ